ncbi:Protein-tyrosine-phosphatase MKP1 [Galdieria sulphuraria]|nr:Protein-tyrosine-phosphatase MKP1 [Galdieria sulphuraria]
MGQLIHFLEEGRELQAVTTRLKNIVTGTPKQKVLASSSFRPLDLSHLLNMDEKLKEESCTPMRQVNYYTNNCTKIRPYLFTGGEKAAKDKDFLTRNKIHYIVELSHRKPKSSYYDSSFEYHHFLLRDQESQELMAVSYQVEAIVDEAIKRNVAVLVHCQLGISRSIAVVVACLMMREGRSFDSVYDEVCRLRPISAPNNDFMDDLALLQKRLGQGNRELRIYKFSVEDNIIHAEYIPYYTSFANKLSDLSLTLSEDGVYLLQFPMSEGVYLWIGQVAKSILLKTAMTFAKRLVKYEICGPLHSHLSCGESEEEDVEILQEYQGKESESFLQQWKRACSSNLVFEG